MVSLRRLSAPEILSKNETQWRKEYLAKRAQKPGLRPPSKRYAHRDIVEVLAAMSHWKCFYCEQSVKDGHEVDHHIEVAEQPELSFEWDNLYLCCEDCNHKLPNRTIPVAECVDPCAPASHPEEHLTFDDECIRPKAGSQRGSQTIKKYKLDRQRLDYQRCRQLRKFDTILLKLLERCRLDGGRKMNAAEREILQGFCDVTQPFSLMFATHLARKTDVTF